MSEIWHVTAAGLLWDSSWHPPAVGSRSETPEKTEPLVGARSRDCSAADVDEGRAVALSVHAGDTWPLWQRREALTRAAALLAERSDLSQA